MRRKKSTKNIEKPKRRGRKPKNPEEIKEYYERKVVMFNPNSGTTHQVFTGVKPCQQINETTQVGVRVLVARYPNFYRMYLYSFHKPGEHTFPRGGVKIWNANFHQMQTFYQESVAIHPEGGYHRFAGVQEIDVDNLPSTDDNKEEPISIE
jgi:hypothetical protein